LFVEHRGEFGYGNSVRRLDHVAAPVPGVLHVESSHRAFGGAPLCVGALLSDVLPANKAGGGEPSLNNPVPYGHSVFVVAGSTPATPLLDLTGRESGSGQSLLAAGALEGIHAKKHNTGELE
jgi:hypothetical protein